MFDISPKNPLVTTMNLRNYSFMGAFSALMAGAALIAPSQGYAQQQGVEELTRGPVHEAFATTVNYDPEPGLLVRMAPPEMIEEIPPDERPDGDNVAWIPGYWGWDEEAGNFIWISGIWRNLPPDRQWIPGYWAAEGSQWQWTSGYWSSEETQEVAYYSKPPKSIESGPNVAAPSDNYVWISGTWVNREERYAWRPGYWEPAHENWTWVPAHYQWTRRGYVFVDGYWDYNVGRRGVVFAPVRFQGDYYRQPNYHYTPTTVIVLNVFLNHLFVRPNYGHYYFGDYYSPRYRNEGYYDSYSYQASRRGYDPIFVYDRWTHRGDRDWDRRKRDEFQYYRDHEDARPPRTWALLQAREEGKRRAGRDNFDFAQPLSRYVSDKNNGQRFRQISTNEREEIVTERKKMRDFSNERQRFEAKAVERDAKGKDDKDNKRVQVMRERFAKSPVVAKRAEQLSGNGAPPKRREFREDKNIIPNEGAAVRGGNEGSLEKQNRDGRPPEGRDDKGPREDKGKPEGNRDLDGAVGTAQGEERGHKDHNPEKANPRKDAPDNGRQGNDPSLQGRNPEGRKGNPSEASPGRISGAEQKPDEPRKEKPKAEQIERRIQREEPSEQKPQQRQPQPEQKSPERQPQPELRQQRQQPEQKPQQRQPQPEQRQQRPQPEQKPQQRQPQPEQRQQRQPQPEQKSPQRQAQPQQRETKPQAQQPRQGSGKKDKSPDDDGEKKGR